MTDPNWTWTQELIDKYAAQILAAHTPGGVSGLIKDGVVAGVTPSASSSATAIQKEVPTVYSIDPKMKMLNSVHFDTATGMFTSANSDTSIPLFWSVNDKNEEIGFTTENTGNEVILTPDIKRFLDQLIAKSAGKPYLPKTQSTILMPQTAAVQPVPTQLQFIMESAFTPVIGQTDVKKAGKAQNLIKLKEQMDQTGIYGTAEFNQLNSGYRQNSKPGEYSFFLQLGPEKRVQPIKISARPLSGWQKVAQFFDISVDATQGPLRQIAKTDPNTGVLVAAQDTGGAGIGALIKNAWHNAVQGQIQSTLYGPGLSAFADDPEVYGQFVEGLKDGIEVQESKKITVNATAFGEAWKRAVDPTTPEDLELKRKADEAEAAKWAKFEKDTEGMTPNQKARILASLPSTAITYNMVVGQTMQEKRAQLTTSQTYMEQAKAIIDTHSSDPAVLEQAQALVRKAIEIDGNIGYTADVHLFTHFINPYWTFSGATQAGVNEEILNNMTLISLQKLAAGKTGHLTFYEVRKIKEQSAIPIIEMVGYVATDPLNPIDFSVAVKGIGGLIKAAKTSEYVKYFKAFDKVLGDVPMEDFVVKELGAIPTNLTGAARDSWVGSKAYQIALNKLYDAGDSGISWAMRQSVRSQALKTGAVANQVFSNIARSVNTPDQLIDAIGDAAEAARILNDPAEDVTTALSKLPFSVNNTDRAGMMEISRIIDPSTWQNKAAKVIEEERTAYRTREFAKIKAAWEKAGKVINEADINAKIDEDFANKFKAGNGAKLFAGEFRKTFINGHRVWHDAEILDDFVIGAIFKDNEALKSTKFGKFIKWVSQTNNRLMGGWYTAVLSMRPAWVIRNYQDNIGRFLISGGKWGGDLRTIIDTVGVPEESIQSLQRTTFSDVSNVVREFMEGGAEPTGFWSFYHHNAKEVYKNIKYGWDTKKPVKSILNGIWPTFKAGVINPLDVLKRGTGDWNSWVEFTFRERLYAAKYLENMEVLKPLLNEELLKNVSPDLVGPAKQLLNASGGNPIKLRQLIDLRDQAVYSFVVPEEVTKIMGLSPIDREFFIGNVRKQVEKYITYSRSQNKVITGAEWNQFFGDIWKEIEKEDSAVRKAMDELKDVHHDLSTGRDADPGDVMEEIMEEASQPERFRMTDELEDLHKALVQDGKLPVIPREELRRIMAENKIVAKKGETPAQAIKRAYKKLDTPVTPPKRVQKPKVTVTSSGDEGLQDAKLLDRYKDKPKDTTYGPEYQDALANEMQARAKAVQIGNDLTDRIKAAVNLTEDEKLKLNEVSIQFSTWNNHLTEIQSRNLELTYAIFPFADIRFDWDSHRWMWKRFEKYHTASRIAQADFANMLYGAVEAGDAGKFNFNMIDYYKKAGWDLKFSQGRLVEITPTIPVDGILPRPIREGPQLNEIRKAMLSRGGNTDFERLSGFRLTTEEAFQKMGIKTDLPDADALSVDPGVVMMDTSVQTLLTQRVNPVHPDTYSNPLSFVDMNNGFIKDQSVTVSAQYPAGVSLDVTPDNIDKIKKALGLTYENGVAVNTGVAYREFDGQNWVDKVWKFSSDNPTDDEVIASLIEFNSKTDADIFDYLKKTYPDQKIFTCWGNYGKTFPTGFDFNKLQGMKHPVTGVEIDMNDLKLREELGLVDGGPIPEISYLMPGMSNDVGLQIGKLYNQEAVLTPSGFIYQDGKVLSADLPKTAFDSAPTKTSPLGSYYTDVFIGAEGQAKSPVRYQFTFKDPNWKPDSTIAKALAEWNGTPNMYTDIVIKIARKYVDPSGRTFLTSTELSSLARKISKYVKDTHPEIKIPKNIQGNLNKVVDYILNSNNPSFSGVEFIPPKLGIKVKSVGKLSTGKELTFPSDRMRLEYLKNPSEVVSVNDFSVAPKANFTEDNDFVWVRETPDNFVYQEKWLPSCRSAFASKYGISTNEAILQEFPKRLQEISSYANLRLINHEIVNGVSVAIFEKPKLKGIANTPDKFIKLVTDAFNEDVGRRFKVDLPKINQDFRANLRKGFKDNFGLDDDYLDLQDEWMDVVAKEWAKRTKQPAELYWLKRLAGVVNNPYSLQPKMLYMSGGKPVWYSPLEDIVENVMKNEKYPDGMAVLARLKSIPGIRPQELEVTGIDNLLMNITKEDLKRGTFEVSSIVDVPGDTYNVKEMYSTWYKKALNGADRSAVDNWRNRVVASLKANAEKDKKGPLGYLEDVLGIFTQNSPSNYNDIKIAAVFSVADDYGFEFLTTAPTTMRISEPIMELTTENILKLVKDHEFNLGEEWNMGSKTHYGAGGQTSSYSLPTTMPGSSFEYFATAPDFPEFPQGHYSEYSNFIFAHARGSRVEVPTSEGATFATLLDEIQSDLHEGARDAVKRIRWDLYQKYANKIPEDYKDAIDTVRGDFISGWEDAHPKEMEIIKNTPAYVKPIAGDGGYGDAIIQYNKDLEAFELNYELNAPKIPDISENFGVPIEVDKIDKRGNVILGADGKPIKTTKSVNKFQTWLESVATPDELALLKSGGYIENMESYLTDKFNREVKQWRADTPNFKFDFLSKGTAMNVGKALNLENSLTYQRRVDVIEQALIDSKTAGLSTNDQPEEWLKLRDLFEAVSPQPDLRMTHKGMVPKYPYSKDYNEQILKRLIRRAVDDGDEYFLWTTGQQQVSRYGDVTIQWEKLGDDSFEVKIGITDPDGTFRNYNQPYIVKTFEDVRQKLPGEAGSSWAESLWKKMKNESGDIPVTDDERLARITSKFEVNPVGVRGERAIINKETGEVVGIFNISDERLKGTGDEVLVQVLSENNLIPPELLKPRTGGSYMPMQEGMENYYDKVIPEIFQTWAKKYGFDIEITDIEYAVPGGSPILRKNVMPTTMESGGVTTWIIWDGQNGRTLRQGNRWIDSYLDTNVDLQLGFKSKEAAQAHIDGLPDSVFGGQKLQKVHGFKITDSLRNWAAEPKPLFLQDGEGLKRAGIFMQKDGRGLITGFLGAMKKGGNNALDALHELTHVPIADLPAQDWGVISKWLSELPEGQKVDITGDDFLKFHGQWADGSINEADFARYTKAQENINNGIMRSLVEGTLPVTDEVKTVFQKIAKWIKDWYEKFIKGNGLEVETTPEVRRVFAKLFGVVEEPAEQVVKVSEDVGEFWKVLKQSKEFDTSAYNFTAKELSDPNEFIQAARARANSWTLFGDEFQKNQLNEMADEVEAWCKKIEEDAQARLGKPPKTRTVPPVPKHKLSIEFNEWLSFNKESAESMNRARNAILAWQDYLVDMSEKVSKGDPEAVFFSTLSDEAWKKLQDWSKQASVTMDSVIDVAKHGGQYGTANITGAINQVNDAMIDYTTYQNWEHIFRTIYPFWQFPSRSTVFWAKTIAEHPQIATWYQKYMMMSEREQYQNGLVTSTGDPLPSYRGYIRIPGLNIWVNPLAPFSARYVMNPLMGIGTGTDYNIDDEGQDSGPMAAFLRTYYQVGADFGFSMHPGLMLIPGVRTALGESQAPSQTIVPALDLIPVNWRRWALDKTTQMQSPTLNGIVLGLPAWQNYLIENEALKDVYQQVLANEGNPTKQYELVMGLYNAFTATESGKPDGVPARESSALWMKYRKKVENGQLWKKYLSYFTGVYAKPWTDADSDLLQLRHDNNLLRSMINNNIGASVFGLAADPETRYNDYTDKRFNSPEGLLYSLRQAVSWVEDSDGKIVEEPTERLEVLNERLHIETVTRAYYERSAQIRKEYEEALAKVPVGSPYEMTQPMWDEYMAAMTALDSDPMYVDREKPGDFSYINKPEDAIMDHYRFNWFKTLKGTLRDYDPAEETKMEYLARKADWEKNLSKMASSLASQYRDQIEKDVLALFPLANWSGAAEIGAPGSGLVDRILNQLMEETSPQGMDSYYKKNDTIHDALMNAWYEMYYTHYLEDVAGKSGDEYTAAFNQFNAKYPSSYLTPGMMADWILKNPDYASRGWTKGQIVGAYLESGDALTVQQRQDLGQTEEEAKVDKLFTLISWADPGEQYNALKAQFIKLGGNENDWNLLYSSGGSAILAQPQNKERLESFLNTMARSISSLGIKEPTSVRLNLRIEAREQNDLFKKKVIQQFGSDIYTLMAWYYGELSYAEQKAYKTTNPGDVARIKGYSDFKSQFGEIYSTWKSFYDPDGKASKTSTAPNYQNMAQSAYIELMSNSTMPLDQAFSGTFVGLPSWDPAMVKTLGNVVLYEYVQAVKSRAKLSTAAVTYLEAMAKLHPEWAEVIEGMLKQVGE